MIKTTEIVTLLTFFLAINLGFSEESKANEFEKKMLVMQDVVIDLIKEGKIENLEMLIDMTDPRVFEAINDLRQSYSGAAEDKLRRLLNQNSNVDFNSFSLDDINLDNLSVDKALNKIKNSPEARKVRAEVKKVVNEANQYIKN